MLGTGGMGAVYSATEVALGRLVAVKVLAPALAQDEHFRLRFEREARAAAAISHPNVVRVYTVGETEGDPPLPYIIMQYVGGTPLNDLLRERGRLPERRARHLLRDVAAALAAAHERDLVHRDVKPANILIEAGSGRAYVADFGISAALSPRAIGGAEPLADDGLIVGTPPYMSPEQAVGDSVGPASDIYSLGVMAYELLSGSLPFDATSPEAWRAAHLVARPPPLHKRRKGVSDDVARLVELCLAKEPGSRPTASDLARELVPSAEEEILWPPPGLSQLPRLGRRLRSASVVLVGSTVLLLGALAATLPGTHTAAGWWEAWAGESVMTTKAPAGWLVFLWQLTALLSTLVLCLGVAVLGGLFVRWLRAVLGLRSRGWQLQTIRDTLADPDGRTGLLLSGTGEFAAKTPSERDRLRGFRRVAHDALLATAGWIVAVLVLWSISVLLGAPLQPAGGPPIGLTQAVVLGMPLLVGLSVSTIALLRERRLSGRSWRRPHTGTFAVPTDFSVEDVTAWYADLPAGPGPKPVGRVPSQLGFRLLGAGIPLMVGWIIVTVGLLVTSTLLAGRLARRLGPETGRVATLAEVGGPRGHLESRDVLQPYLPTPQPRVSSDTLLPGLLAESPLGLPPYPVEPRLILGSDTAGLATTAFVANAIRRAAELSADTIRMLATLADHPRTQRLRLLARTSGVTLPGEGGAFSAIRMAMEANAAGAVLAIARNDTSEAAIRLGENAVIAEVALTTPRYWSDASLLMLQSLVLLPLAEIERLRQNGRREADLRRVAQSVRETKDLFDSRWTRGAIGLGSDPRDLQMLQRLLSDSTIPAGLRHAVVQRSGDAVCLNAREWLAGADPARQRELGDSPTLPEAFQSGGMREVVRRIRYCAAHFGA